MDDIILNMFSFLVLAQLGWTVQILSDVFSSAASTVSVARILPSLHQAYFSDFVFPVRKSLIHHFLRLRENFFRGKVVVGSDFMTKINKTALYSCVLKYLFFSTHGVQIQKFKCEYRGENSISLLLVSARQLVPRKDRRHGPSSS